MATDKPQGNLAFGAALIHGLGLIALAIVVAVHYALGPSHEFSFAIIAVAGATSGVAILWSLLLFYRSFKSGEQSRWHVIAFTAAMLEVAALFMLLWSAALEPSRYRVVNSAVTAGLPVFGPFLALASIIAVPIALRQARKVNADEAELGIPERKRSGFSSGVKRYVMVLAVLGIFLLPVPLYLLGATAVQFYDDDTEEPVGWGAALVDLTPDFIRDATESFIYKARTYGQSYSRCWQRLLRSGRVSKARLLKLHNSGSWEVWKLLKNRYPDAALESADKVGRSGLRYFEQDVPRWFANRANEQQILYYIDVNNKNVNLRFRDDFLYAIMPEHVPEAALPKLEELAESGVAPAINLLLWRASNERVLELWRNYLSSQKLRKEAARHMVSCIQRDLPEIVVEYLNAPLLDTRGTAVLQLAVYRDGLRPHVFRNAQNARYVAVTKRLCELLDDSDDVIKLSAMCVLSDIFREGEAPDVLAGATKKIQQYDVPSHQIKLDDAERAEIQATRAAVESFLSSAPRP